MHWPSRRLISCCRHTALFDTFVPMVHELPRFKEENLAPINDSELLLIQEDDDLQIIEDDEVVLVEEDCILHLSDTEAGQAEEASHTQSSLVAQSKSWKIIIVDDDPVVHQATQIALKNFTFEGNPVEFISAFSATEGKQIISRFNDEAASILLDVVMESNHAGLDLIEFIRESLQNKRVRIILRTGQPGEAPSESVILDYDINDYQLKLDMTRQRLITSIVSALRSYRDLVTIDEQNKLLTETLAKLQQSEQELKKYSHNLELLVSERTAELQDANEKLKRLATLDGLTQVANRQYFDHYLNKHWQSALQNQAYITLLLIDVDYFKPFNDCYGHLAGDHALKQVSQALSRALGRSHDLVARYGGEEFGIIIPQTKYAGAQTIAAHIFRNIETLKIPHKGSQVNDFLTISMGISCLIPQPGIKPDSLIDMADMALYQAKALGRNQWCLYRDIQSESSIN